MATIEDRRAIHLSIPIPRFVDVAWQWAVRPQITRATLRLSSVTALCFGMCLGLLLPGGIVSLHYMMTHGLAYPGDTAMATLTALFDVTFPAAMMMLCIGIVANIGATKGR